MRHTGGGPRKNEEKEGRKADGCESIDQTFKTGQQRYRQMKALTVESVYTDMGPYCRYLSEDKDCQRARS
jgi:hypothetical protein